MIPRQALGLLCALTLPAVPCLAGTSTYRLTVDVTWSETTHPGAFPPSAHLSWIGGATHTSAVSFWSEGSLASPGIVEMAETGVTFTLVNEVGAAVSAGTAGGVLDWPYSFCPAGSTAGGCGALVVEFDIDDAFPLVTLGTMVAPTPDWFVGVSGLALHDGSNWIDDITVQLFPYDAGTRDNNAFALFGPQTMPPDPVSLITAASGQLIGPGSLGSFRFERLGSGVEFCNAADGSLASCPCGNSGLPQSGCDTAQQTGGVHLQLTSQVVSQGMNQATLNASGFPPMSAPAAIALRSTSLAPAPVVFGDGIRCVGLTNLVRLAATSANGGTSTHTFGHGVGSGSFHYQVWFRNTPASFCDATAAFNLSNGVTLEW